MKKTVLLLIFCLLFCVCKPTAITVNADTTASEYLRVIDNSTPIYRDKNGQDFLFYLPYSYYVKVIEEYSTLLHVECFGGQNAPLIDGYVPKDKLLSEPSPTRLPYLDCTVTTFSATVLYQDALCTKPLRLIFADRTLGYYGSVGEDTFIYFVCYMGDTGYVKEDTLTPFQVPVHPDPITQESVPLPDDKQNLTTNVAPNYNGLKLAIIVCLLMAGVIALFSVIKRKPNANTCVTLCEEDDY